MTDKDRITVENGIIHADNKSVEFYLSKGFDKAMAEYFAKGRRTITSVKANADFTLTLSFDNGECRIYNCAPLLTPGTVFEPFMKPENFMRVYLDDMHTVCWDIDPNVNSDEVWSNKVDICPDDCYVYSTPIAGGAVNA